MKKNRELKYKYECKRLKPELKTGNLERPFLAGLNACLAWICLHLRQERSEGEMGKEKKRKGEDGTVIKWSPRLWKGPLAEWRQGWCYDCWQGRGHDCLRQRNPSYFRYQGHKTKANRPSTAPFKDISSEANARSFSNGQLRFRQLLEGGVECILRCDFEFREIVGTIDRFNWNWKTLVGLGIDERRKLIYKNVGLLVSSEEFSDRTVLSTWT